MFKLDFVSSKVELWRYQDEELEKMYAEFVAERELTDDKLQAEIKEW